MPCIKMNRKMKLILIQLLMLTRLSSWSQTDRVDSLLMDVMGNEIKTVTTTDTTHTSMALYGGLNYDSKSFYAGREVGDDMYNMNGYLFFFHSKGYFLGASGSWYSQLDPGYSSTVLMGGYYKYLNKKKSLSFRTSYTRFIYYQPDPELNYNYNNSLSAGLSVKNKWIGGRFSSRLLFGKDVGMDLSPGIYSNIKLYKINKYDYISFEPEVSMLISTETIAYETSGNYNSRLPGTEEEFATKDVYGLLNTQLYLPLCITWRDFDLELSYTINMPVTQDETVDYPVSSYFSVSFGYMIPF